MTYSLIGIPYGLVGGLILLYTWDEYRASRRGKPFAVTVTVAILATVLAVSVILTVAQYRENQRQRDNAALVNPGNREQ